MKVFRTPRGIDTGDAWLMCDRPTLPSSGHTWKHNGENSLSKTVTVSKNLMYSLMLFQTRMKFFRETKRDVRQNSRD